MIREAKSRGQSVMSFGWARVIDVEKDEVIIELSGGIKIKCRARTNFAQLSEVGKSLTVLEIALVAIADWVPSEEGEWVERETQLPFEFAKEKVNGNT